MTMLAECFITFFLIVSGVFGLVGSYGMVKLRNTMQRLHAPTKATTLGVGGVLIASMLYFFLIKVEPSFHELMITLFLFLTAPVSAKFIAKTYMLDSVSKDEIPTTGHDIGWAAYEDIPDNAE